MICINLMATKQQIIGYREDIIHGQKVLVKICRPPRCSVYIDPPDTIPVKSTFFPTDQIGGNRRGKRGSGLRGDEEGGIFRGTIWNNPACNFYKRWKGK